MSYASAIRESLRDEMRRDPNVILIGEDIGLLGGAFKVTAGLKDEFGPERVLDSPISEGGITGVALGASLKGIRPVVELMFMDFVQIAMEELVTEASKARFLSAGKLSAPMVVRAPYGLGRALGPQHSQFFPSWFVQVPGLDVVLPSSPGDARGLLKTAIRASRPVLFIESAALYSVLGPVSEEEYSIGFGEANVLRTGNDVTIVAVSRLVPEAVLAAQKLSKSGIAAEVIDPRTLSPLDRNTLVSSVNSTGRLLVASDDFVYGGVGSAIIADILEDTFYHLKAPPIILGPPYFPPPADPDLETQYLLSSDRIVDSAKTLVAK
jgi:acetoin:2,6-dichlorophenolindophenol oxidoreductase subunit beta